MNVKSIGVVAFAMLLLIGPMSGIAYAQEESQTSTPTPTPTEEETVVAQLSDSLTLVSYNFHDGKVTLVIEADYSQDIAIVDRFGDMENGGGFSNTQQKVVTLDSGKNKITIDVTEWNGYAGVSLGYNGGGGGITQEVEGTSVFTLDYSAETLIIMLAVGVVVGIGLVLVVAYKKDMDYTSKVKQEL